MAPRILSLSTGGRYLSTSGHGCFYLGERTGSPIFDRGLHGAQSWSGTSEAWVRTTVPVFSSESLNNSINHRP